MPHKCEMNRHDFIGAMRSVDKSEDTLRLQADLNRTKETVFAMINLRYLQLNLQGQALDWLSAKILLMRIRRIAVESQWR